MSIIAKITRTMARAYFLLLKRIPNGIIPTMKRIASSGNEIIDWAVTVSKDPTIISKPIIPNGEKKIASAETRKSSQSGNR